MEAHQAVAGRAAGLREGEEGADASLPSSIRPHRVRLLLAYPAHRTHSVVHNMTHCCRIREVGLGA